MSANGRRLCLLLTGVLLAPPASAFQSPVSDTVAALARAAGEQAQAAILDSAIVNSALYEAVSKRFGELLKAGNMTGIERLASAELAIARRVGDRELESKALSDLGTVLFRAEDFNGAVGAYRKALEAAENTRSPSRIAGTLNGLGLAMRDAGSYADSLAAFDRAENLARQGSDPVLLARILNNGATTLQRTGDLRRAALKLEEALSIAEQRNERLGQSFVLNNLGNVYQRQGDYEAALGYYSKSLEIKRQEGNPREVITSLSNLGLNQHYVGRDREALVTLTAALSMARSSGAARLTASGLLNRAMVERKLGQTTDALADLREALALAESGGDKSSIALILSSVAETEFVLGQSPDALAKMRRALDLARDSGSRPDFAQVAEPVGRALLRMGLDDEAEPVLREAMQTVESMRSDTVAREVNLRRFLSTHVRIYQALSELLVRRGKLEEALQIAERAKARVLVDVLRAGGREAITGRMSTAEQSQEHALRATVARASPLVARRKAEGELAAFQTRLYLTYPEIEFQRAAFEPASLAAIGTLLTDPAVAVIEYVVADETTFAFVLRGRRGLPPRVTVHKISTGETQVSALVNKLRGTIASRGYDWAASARRLHQLLIEPALGDLVGATTLIVVPEGPLWQVPFAVLQGADRKLLIERSAIFYAPSLTALYLSARDRKPQPGRPTLLAFANPDFAGQAAQLPGASREALSIAALYGQARSKVYTSAQALESRVRAEASRYSVLHFATHGSINDSNPLYSYLRLTPDPRHGDDGLLEAREMLDLNLRAEVAVLSACDTARGVTANGEGVIGMSWALLVAGAASTVVSHWQVDSASTERFMVAFHRSMTSSPQLAHKARALRSAALDLLATREYRHPFYWAPFVLIGNGF